MNWDQVVKKVSSHVVKIETPSGHGTGFLFMYNDAKTTTKRGQHRITF